MTADDTQILLNKLQSNINQLELTNKGALNALAGFMCLETGLSREKQEQY